MRRYSLKLGVLENGKAYDSRLTHAITYEQQKPVWWRLLLCMVAYGGGS